MVKYPVLYSYSISILAVVSTCSILGSLVLLIVSQGSNTALLVSSLFFIGLPLFIIIGNFRQKKLGYLTLQEADREIILIHRFLFLRRVHTMDKKEVELTSYTPFNYLTGSEIKDIDYFKLALHNGLDFPFIFKSDDKKWLDRLKDKVDND